MNEWTHLKYINRIKDKHQHVRTHSRSLANDSPCDSPQDHSPDHQPAAAQQPATNDAIGGCVWDGACSPGRGSPYLRCDGALPSLHQPLPQMWTLLWYESGRWLVGWIRKLIGYSRKPFKDVTTTAAQCNCLGKVAKQASMYPLIQ